MTVVMVSWILALLSVFSLTFNREVRSDLRLSQGSVESVQAAALARSGVRFALESLRVATVNEWDGIHEGWDGSPTTYRKLALPTGFTSVGRPPRPDSNDQATYGVEDENRKIPAFLVEPDMLERISGLSPRAVSRLAALAAPGQSLDDATVWAEIERLEESDQEILRRVLAEVGVKSVNINTAPSEVLEVLGFQPDGVRSIVGRRSGLDGVLGTSDDTPLTSVLVPQQGLGSLNLGPEDAALLSSLARAGHIGVVSDVFRIRSRGWVRESRGYCEIEAIVHRESGAEDFVVWDWSERWLN